MLRYDTNISLSKINSKNTKNAMYSLSTNYRCGPFNAAFRNFYFKASSTMSSSSMDEAVRVRN